MGVAATGSEVVLHISPRARCYRKRVGSRRRPRLWELERGRRSLRVQTLCVCMYVAPVKEQAVKTDEMR